MSSREGGPIGTLCVSLSYANQLCAKWAERIDREIILKPACHSLPSSRPKLAARVRAREARIRVRGALLLARKVRHPLRLASSAGALRVESLNGSVTFRIRRERQNPKKDPGGH
jgi:hypothetical protein